MIKKYCVLTIVQFTVKDKSQALRDADAIRGYGYTMSDMADWYSTAAESYRRSMYHKTAYPNLDEWKV